MTMKNDKTLRVKKASLEAYHVIQNMARFYVYDLSRSCGLDSEEWAIPKDGLYEHFDFTNYFTENDRDAYIIEICDELAGFVLVNQVTTSKTSKWNIGEFFILGRFQNKGYGQEVAKVIWKNHPGRWEVSVIPENTSALEFWRKAIREFTLSEFKEESKVVDFDEHQPNRVIFTFESRRK